MGTERRDDGQIDDMAPPSSSKIAKLSRDYDLSGIGEDLERRWLGQGHERQSLRSLADHFNQLLLKTELERVGEDPIEGEVKNYYQLLTGEDVSQANRTKVETRLHRTGLDIESLRRDFVSHQAIHNYLTDVRGAELPTDDENTLETIGKRDAAIQRLKSRLVTVTERNIKNLRNTGALSVGDFDIVMNLTIHCSDCGTNKAIGEFLRERGCQCRLDGE